MSLETTKWNPKSFFCDSYWTASWV